MAHFNPINLSTKPAGYYSYSREEMLKFIPKDAGLILDVGCGDGSFGLAVKKILNTEVWGVEQNGEVGTIARGKIDNVLVGDISKLMAELPESRFDCIVFNDVLEHLVDPFKVLMEIKKKLSAKGIIICSIPNTRYIFLLYELLVKKQWRYGDEGILDKTHLRFFTKKSFTDTLKALGYKVLRIEGINGVRLWKFLPLNILSLGYLSDTRYLQFVCVAKPL